MNLKRVERAIKLYLELQQLRARIAALERKAQLLKAKHAQAVANLRGGEYYEYERRCEETSTQQVRSLERLLDRGGMKG